MKKEKAEETKRDYLTITREICLVVGFLLLAYGIWSIYPPAAYIYAGVLLMAAGLPRTQKGGD